jgi:hypothetical protein
VIRLALPLLAVAFLAACGGRAQPGVVRDVVRVTRTVTVVRTAPAASKPKAVKARGGMTAATRALVYRKILYGKQGVGFSSLQIRRLLGLPDRIQDIAGMKIWYYGIDAYPAPTFQLSFDANGYVSQINRY